MEVLSGFGLVLGGFHKDLVGFWRIAGGSREEARRRQGRISGPLRKVCSMRKEVNVSKCVEWRVQACGQKLGTPYARCAVADEYAIYFYRNRE